MMETMYGWLTCDLSRIVAQSLADYYFLSFSSEANTFVQCMRKLGTRLFSTFKAHPEYTTRIMKFRNCLLQLREVCLKSKFRIIKTIRAPMTETWETLQKIEGSKVLHLIRDPRPTIDSKRKSGMCSRKLGGVKQCSKKHCDRQVDDTIIRQNAAIKEPDRFGVVLYENIVTTPLKASKRMYKFAGLEFTKQVSDYVYNVTLGGDNTGCKVCQQGWQMGKSNSSTTSHVTAWQTNMKPLNIQLTQLACIDVMKTYGYEYFLAEDRS